MYVFLFKRFSEKQKFLSNSFSRLLFLKINLNVSFSYKINYLSNKIQLQICVRIKKNKFSVYILKSSEPLILLDLTLVN